MSKKKLTTIVTAAVMGTMIVIGGTLAWFTDKGETTNVVTFGNVDIKLQETQKDGNLSEKGLKFENIVPGDKFKKDPTITNIGKNDCYIRAKITFTEGAPIGDDSLDIKSAEWKKGSDGYYYYKGVVKNGMNVVLFNEVKIPGELGNNVADKTFNIKVDAEAIQSDNFEVNFESDTPWGTTPITAETYKEPTK